MKLRLRLAVAALVPATFLLLGCNGSGTTTGPGGECQPGTIVQAAAADTSHVNPPTRVNYSSNPPAIGQHYPQTAANGAHVQAVQPENWVHNLEHGSIVFLYDCPQGCPEIVDSLQAFAEARPADDGGAFRWVLTPYTGMPTKVAVVAWGWIYRSECFNLIEVRDFVNAHYRQAPEDIPPTP